VALAGADRRAVTDRAAHDAEERDPPRVYDRSNLAGDRVHVLAHADAGAGLVLDRGLVTFETAGLP
jgi:hypothetical protein